MPGLSERAVVSVVIKALNEERHIEASVRSALAAIEAVGSGEVILADSCSSDKTVEIAGQYPITIVQLKRADERRCGIGPELGYQVSRGEFVYILDGDMELDKSFLPAAVEAMHADPRLGGVAGIVEEMSDASYQFRARKRRGSEMRAGVVHWLDMGGLYRREALEQAGFFSDRNLHAFEEQDLGNRLTQHGWKLQRLDRTGVRHFGHTDNSLRLLLKRWQSGYLDGAGELLRASLGRPYFWPVLWRQKHLFVALGIWIGLVIGLLRLGSAPWILQGVLAAVMLLLVLRAAKTRSLKDAFAGQVVWQVTSIAMLRGFLRGRRDPHEAIEKIVLKGQ